MTMNAVLIQAMAAQRSALVAQIENLIRWQAGRMLNDLGPELRNAGNDWTWARVWRSVLRPCMAKTTDGWAVDDAKLARYAVEAADAAIAAWQDKIAAKLGEMDALTLHRMDGVSFAISGIRQGRTVRIEQRCIINVSSQGKLFHQFPARLAVDGKAISEAAYKKAFAA